MPLSDVPTRMGYSEACRMLDILLTDPSTQVAAAINGWQYPLSREGIVQRDEYDLFHEANSKKKPTPYPRPWDEPPKMVGAGTSLTIDEFKAVKAALQAKPKQPRDALGRFTKAQ